MTATAEPGQVWRVINGFGTYWATVAGVRLGLFDALAAGPAGADALAPELGGEPDRIAVLADALVAAGLLERDDAGYRLTPTADALLVRGRPRAMHDLLLWSPGPHANWVGLDAIVRGAPPPEPIEDDAAVFYARLAAATSPTQRAVAAAVLPQLGLPAGARLLELGAGAAPWAATMLATDAAATAVVNDLPGVVPVTTEALQPFGDRVAFAAGDYLAADLPPGPYDVVVLGHVLRAERRERAAALVARAAAALGAGGALVVTEYLGGRDPARHPQAALLGLTMLAGTAAGGLCTRADVEAWLAAARCGAVRLLDPVANTDVVVATAAALVEGEAS
jgi:hypothetical protein